MKKLLTMALAAALWSCGQGGSQGGEKYYGKWQQIGDCHTCATWVFSPTDEGGVLATVVMSDKSAGGSNKTRELNATYQPESGKLVIHGPVDITAGINNGKLYAASVTYEKVQ